MADALASLDRMAARTFRHDLGHNLIGVVDALAAPKRSAKAKASAR
jgi:hypothetical protein